jgi:hypothetical protein
MGTNTGIGIGIGIPFKNFSSGGRQPLPPDLKASLKGVWIAYGKSNNDADRSIVKNLVDLDNPFIISNAAFKLNSGFGKYEITFQYFPYRENVTNVSDSKVVFGIGGQLLIPYPAITENIPSFKIKVNGLSGTYHFRYYYRSSDGVQHSVDMAQDGYYELPICYNVQSSSDGTNCGFANNGTDVITITQIPSFEGAFVTDGIDDLITSTKTVQEMGITDEITVVSMIHKISSDNNWTNLIGELKGDHTFVANRGINTDKTGIYGYTYNYNENAIVINNILGDKNDYIVKTSTSLGLDNKYYVTGFRSVGIIQNISQVAWYWTIIANKVLTTDQINQVIAYFNLDRTLKPDILCNTIKQGITNENHAEFGDKLIDYSGNGRDIQLNNIAWDGDSGIGKYNYPNWKVNVTRGNKYGRIVYYDSINGTYSADFKGMTELYKSYGLSVEIRVNRANTVDFHSIKEDGIYTVATPDDTTSIDIRFGGENVYNASCDITITQIPSHAGALCLDGVNDFGKVTGMPIYKDYTVIADYIRTFAKENVRNSPILSKSKKGDDGAFIFNYVKYSTSDTLAYDTLAYSFASINNVSYINDFERNIYYQSKYTNNGNSINAGKGVDTDGMWLGTNRDNDYRFFNGAIYSLMTFPYSMSEFLIERQLKKHKLGTLYPDMVEFRPVIKSNASYDNIVFYYKNEKVENGTYLTVGSSIGMHICLSSNSVNEIKSITINGIPATFKFHDANNNIYQYDFNLTSKSPQKINITIDEYIRYEDIVQPYPSLFTLIDYDTEEVYSWGSKLKVGARFKGNVVNLLPNMYEWQGNVLYNGEVLDWGINPGVVAKEMVFSWNMPFKYLIDNNEPKCILSPRLLRIPNSSYKILGYIPDISGHGNNGVIHNSAYAEGSGVNEDGSYQLDGVDDFVTIPTIAGKQVLIKLNWQNKAIGNLIYDQRDNSSTTSFAIIPISINDTTNNKIAYQTKNANGITYIDGIRNEYIESYSLENIIHNITITNPDVSNKTVALGASNRTTADYFAKYALYDFMLFDDISTEDKIKELNEYVGIEAKVELPPYYWDAYGKSNLDADRDTIQQRGVAVGDYDLTNTNFAYDKMSGFGGYEFTKFDNTSEWTNRNRKDGIEIIKKNGYSFTAKRIGTGQYFYDFQNRSTTVLNKSLTVKAVSNNNTCIRWEYKYRTAEKPDIDSTLLLVRQAMIPNVPITVALPYKTEQEKADLGVTEGSDSYLFYFDPSDIPVGEEYTVEMLPLYPNGLLYDAVTDYSENVNIPVFTDFTAIMKRKWLKNQGCPLIKGSKVYEGGNGNALLFEWDKAYNFVFYKRTDIMEREVPENISFITPTNYNGNVITRGSGQDTNGICIAGDGNAGFANMVFYKLILYPKTIPLLQINFLKNLMERDEIIDLNNPIFIKNE